MSTSEMKTARVPRPRNRFLIGFHDFFFRGAPPDASIERREKVALANGMCITGIVTMVSLSVMDALKGDYVTVAVFLLISLFLGLVTILHHRTHKYTPVVTTGFVIVAVGFLYFLAGGTDRSTGFIWCYTLPLLATFLLGSRRGAVASALLFVAAVVYFATDPWWPSWNEYRLYFEVRFSVSYAIISFFAFLFQRLKEFSYSLVTQKNEELVIAHDEAESANRAKSEFLANMSHELRTPLNHIIGFTELVHDQKIGPLEHQQREYLSDVLDSSRHLLSLINDILDMSKIEAGKMELNLTMVDVQMTIDQSIRMHQGNIEKRDISVSAENLATRTSIMADERKLRQILYNLISNAVKFTPEGGSVNVVLKETDNDELEVSVHDSGIGIEEEHIEDIFDAFDRGDASASEFTQGTGLGLSLTKSLVEIHGGRITAQSEGPGKGSTFVVSIPIRGPEEQK